MIRIITTIERGRKFLEEEKSTGQLIVHYSPGAVPMLTKSENVRASISVGRRWITLHDEEPDHIEEAAERLRARPDVFHVEINHPVYYCFSPNDQYFPGNGRYNSSHAGLIDQWGLTRVEAPSAWDITRSRAGDRVIAIIDTGVDSDHPELANRMFKDSSGKVIGYNSLENNGNFKDDNGHGTHVAGIASGFTNNGLGIAGMAFATSRIMPVKVLGRDGGGSDYSVAQGIVWAADHGAHILNMSLGSSTYSQTIQMAINYAWTKGCIVVAAAGNDGTEKVNYPAGCNLALGIASTEQDGTTSSFSNSGRHVDCAAPGSDYLATMPTYPVFLTEQYGFYTNYDALSGTSMATPVVSGLLGLLWATYPEATNDQLRRLITQTTTKLSGTQTGWSPIDGYGEVRASRAVRKDRNRTSLGCITGQVINALGLPVTGAKAASEGKSFTTSTDGMFRISNLQSDMEHSLTITASLPTGRKAISIQVYVADSCDTDVTITLK